MMRNCVVCNKELGRTTKGKLCQLCYRNRNYVDQQIPIAENISQGIPCDNTTDVNYVPDLNDDIGDRLSIEFLKGRMLQDHKRQIEIITLLKDEIKFMKSEINHKNDIIEKLINGANCLSKQPIHKSSVDSCKNGNINYDIYNANIDDNDALTNYMQWQPVDYAHETCSDHIMDSEFCNNNNPQFDPLELSIIGSDESFFNDSSIINDDLSMQLSDARYKYHQTFLHQESKSNDMVNNDIKSANDPSIWPPNTTLILGDSIISGIIEKRLCRNDKLVKVRSFPGAKVEDLFHYIVPLLKKRPDNIIIHCGTNNTGSHEPQEIVDELLKLKMFILQSLPDSTVIFSYPTVRNDNPFKNNTLQLVRSYLNQLKVESIHHDNITPDCLGKSKLHLSAQGTARLAMNFKSFIRHL